MTLFQWPMKFLKVAPTLTAEPIWNRAFMTQPSNVSNRLDQYFLRLQALRKEDWSDDSRWWYCSSKVEQPLNYRMLNAVLHDPRKGARELNGGRKRTGRRLY